MTDQELKELVLVKRTKKILDEECLRMQPTNNKIAEEFFYNSLAHTQTLAGIHYDFVDKNWKKR